MTEQQMLRLAELHGVFLAKGQARAGACAYTHYFWCTAGFFWTGEAWRPDPFPWPRATLPGPEAEDIRSALLVELEAVLLHLPVSENIRTPDA